MSGDVDFDKILQECGFDANDLNALNDSALRLGPQEVERGGYYTPDLSTQYYDPEPGVDQYLEDVATSATRAYTPRRLPMVQQYSQGGRSDDDIEQFESSDPFGYGTSSPTPSQPRGFAVPTAYQAPVECSRAPAPQSMYVQPRVANNSQGSAYMRQGGDGTHQRGRGSSVSVPRLPAQSPLSQPSTRGSNPRNAYNLRLRPVSELPDIYRGIFKFGVFNAVQTKCYQTIMETKENMVVSAPTGGGKTVLFELALIEILMTSGHDSAFKCVYIAPTKALCSERTRDWTAKFEPLGIKCCEMTGDTIQVGKSAWSAARNAKIIITTSEKWDSLTRSWHDHGDFLSEIKLFLVDEVHVLNESRGSTLEVVISRMKTRAHGIRFILVSATVPNIRDIADWIGNPSVDCNVSATVYEFGEEYRPCKITRHIYGYPRKNQNDFQFARTLDYKLYSVIQQHACAKPILVFCSTRKGVLSTAEQLLKEYDEAVTNRQTTPWTPPKHFNRTFHDKRLEKLARAGLGIHHAGLSLDDRRATEELYLDGSLRVVCATSTLAVGINLPAHTVVIKGVKLYVTNGWQEYSDLDVVQMIGRAGRPQFDKEGIAIILCEQELEHKYRNLAQGKTILESSLHENLLEHINSEIGIGAIKDIQSAKDWLRNSFLRQRIQKNPGRYHIGRTAGQTWEEKMDDMVLQAVKKLETNELISTNGDGNSAELSVTEYGNIMSKYYIRQSTMGSIIKLPERPSVREILEVISCAEELGDVRLRGGDRQVYNKMRDHADIRYKIKKVEKASDKSFILIQAVLGGISLSAPEYKTSDSQPALDALSVFRHTSRIARVVAEVAIVKKNGAQLKHGLELGRCLAAKAWEDRPVVLKQIESIGEKSLKVLAEHGITSLQTLQKQEPARIEVLLNRRPPYGHEILQFVQDMPQYGLSISVARNGIVSYSGKKPVSVELKIECHILRPLSDRTKARQRSRFLGMTSILTTTSDLDFIDFRRISTKALKDSKSFTVSAELTKPSQSVCVLISSDNFAGLTVTQTYKPSIPAREYPTMDTHPKTSNDLLVEECEQDPEFWDKMGCDDDYADEGKCGAAHPLAMHVGPPLEPKTLPNGNYSCNHTCKDKNVCRHLCCREGTTKPPPASKKLLDEKKVPQESSTPSNAATKKGDERTQRKKVVKEDNRLAELESLHRRTSTSNSLRLGEGQCLKLDRGIPARKSRPTLKPTFDVDFADLGDEADKDEESADDMPDTKELLASTQPKNKAKSPSSDNSFSNSELDAIMLTVDTTNSPSGSADVSFMNPSTLRDGKAGSHAGRTKRKSRNDENSGTFLSQTPTEPATKKTKLVDHFLTQSDGNPLFLHDSSLSSTSCPVSYVATDAFDPDIHDYNADEDYFALGQSSCDVVPSTSTAHNADTGISIAKDNLDAGSGGDANHEVTTGAVQNEEGDEYYDHGPDDWAEMQDWILNSGSVQIVG